MQECRQVHVGADDGGTEHAHQELSFDADVEQVHLEADGHRHGGEDQRGGPLHHLEQLLLLQAGLEHLRVGVERVLAGDGEQDAGEHECEGNSRQRTGQRDHHLLLAEPARLDHTLGRLRDRQAHEATCWTPPVM